jgi:NAD(P)-dependent dehydrogenase (short-subunit alcohol dehydrogenase family)
MRDRKETVVITGASAGLGRAIACEFAKHGARIGLLARGQKGLQGADKDVRSAGGTPLILETDVSDPDAVEKAAAMVEARFGPIDVWVNNAMVSVFSPVREMQASEYKRVTDVTYLGVVNGSLAALKRMLPRNQGRIVQVGSALAYRSIPLQSAYCAAKHAIVGFTDSLRCELIHDNSRVRVTIVHMPALNTPQFAWVKSRLRNKAQPVPPIFEPEVGARAVFWAAHHDRGELFVGGSTVEAIVGNKIAPRLLDRYLGHAGYESQQTDEAEDPARADNLWQAVDAERDFGARGLFSTRARQYSVQLWADLRRAKIAAGIGLSALALGFFLRSSRKASRDGMKAAQAAD